MVGGCTLGVVPLLLAGTATAQQGDPPGVPNTSEETWAETKTLDASTVETEIVEDTTARPVPVRTRRGPYKVWVTTGERCVVRFYDPVPEPTVLPPLLPGQSPPTFGKLRRRYLVFPGTSSSVPSTRKDTGQAYCLHPFDASQVPASKPSSPAKSRQEVGDIFVLPKSEIAGTANGRAITGAPVGLWAEGGSRGELIFPATVLNGKQIETVATPTSYEWDTGDSGTAALQTRYVTPGPGSAEQPAVTHVYETKSSVGRPAEGVYTITLTVRWERRYRVIGITDPCNDWCLLDPGETTATLPYQVGEVRAVLVD
jgi:hypothetical protein